MGAVQDVRAPSFYSLAPEIIADVEARNIRNNWNVQRILTVSPISLLPQFFLAETSQRQRAFALDQAKDFLRPLTRFSFVSEKPPHHSVIGSLRPDRANCLGEFCQAVLSCFSQSGGGERAQTPVRVIAPLTKPHPRPERERPSAGVERRRHCPIKIDVYRVLQYPSPSRHPHSPSAP